MRHGLYSLKLLKSTKANITTLVIGNLKVGGTGKTPVSIAIINLLKELNLNVGLVSRGYARKSKGFIEINSVSTPEQVGDESFLIAKHFNFIPAAVCEKRVVGVNTLFALHPTLTAIVLDDAFQHRALNSDVSIILTKWNDLYVQDHIFPLGGLRDLKWRAKNAEVIGVTYVPSEYATAENYAQMRNWLMLKESQILVFFHAQYGAPISLNTNQVCNQYKPSFVFAGLANNEEFFNHATQISRATVCKSYSDHHRYSQDDFEQILSEWRTFDPEENQLLTTEKEFVKIVGLTVD